LLAGKVKEMGYDAETKMSSLQSFWISRASAEQRKGRAGRTGPGVCYRLYSQEIHAHLLPYSIPEIQRIPLESVPRPQLALALLLSHGDCPDLVRILLCCAVRSQIMLQMIAMGVRDPREFQYIERPSNDKLEASLFNLQQHQAITSCDDGTYILTPLGGMLAQLPVDIPVGKMLVLGSVRLVVPYTHHATPPTTHHAHPSESI
jgi:HrpA-like RNA helicase